MTTKPVHGRVDDAVVSPAQPAGRERGGDAHLRLRHPDRPGRVPALQLRNLQTLVEIGADKNTTVVFPAPLMSTIQELGTFLAQETSAVATRRAPNGLRGA